MHLGMNSWTTWKLFGAKLRKERFKIWFLNVWGFVICSTANSFKNKENYSNITLLTFLFFWLMRPRLWCLWVPSVEKITPRTPSHGIRASAVAVTYALWIVIIWRVCYLRAYSCAYELCSYYSGFGVLSVFLVCSLSILRHERCALQPSWTF